MPAYASWRQRRLLRLDRPRRASGGGCLGLPEVGLAVLVRVVGEDGAATVQLGLTLGILTLLATLVQPTAASGDTMAEIVWIVPRSAKG